MRHKILPLFVFLSVFIMLSLSTLLSQAQAQYRSFSGGGGGAAAGPNFEPVKETVDAGTITAGSTSFVVVLFKNEGVSDAKVGDINLYPSSTVSTSISLNQCSEGPLPSGAECAMTLAVSGLQSGSFRIEMLINHNGRSRLTTAVVTGNVEGAAAQADVQSELTVVPETVDFGSLSDPFAQLKTVTLYNQTSEDIIVNDVAMRASANTGLRLEKEEDCGMLKAGASCSVTVHWSPKFKGDATGTILVKHSGPSGLTRIDAMGSYAPSTASDATLYPEAVSGKGLLVTDRSEFDYGSNVDGLSAITASLVNNGSKSLILKDIHLSAADNGIDISNNGCKKGKVLDIGEACPLTLTWAPIRVGPILDDIQISHTGARGILILPVRGTASAIVSRDTFMTTMIDEDKDGSSESIDASASLNGYIVTSLSPRNAVISGPVGTVIVRDGQDVVIAGVSWTAHITNRGVQLSNANQSALLVFDRALMPNSFRSSSDGSTTSGN